MFFVCLNVKYMSCGLVVKRWIPDSKVVGSSPAIGHQY